MGLSLRGVKGVNEELEKQKKLTASIKLARGLVKGGLVLKRESMKLAPVMTGHLRNSAYLKLPAFLMEPEVEVGYTAVYALQVHENPRAGKTGGISPSGAKYKPPKGSTQIAWARKGEWKFLEEPFHSKQRLILRAIMREVKV